MSITKKSFKFLFHHVIFPPRLPQQGDEDEVDGDWPLERRLHSFVHETLESFITEMPPEAKEIWNTAAGMVKDWQEVGRGGAVCQETLTQIISDLKSKGAAALHIRSQNCGWMAYHDKCNDRIIMDAFEASPRAADVMSNPGSLARQLPGVSVAIPSSMLEDTRFCEELSKSIARLATEDVEEMTPKSRKAGIEVPENRDTNHPGLVTEGLMSQLLAFGEYSKAPLFYKNTRDDVNWRSSRLPWRRSPHWFVLRVALQILLQRALPEGEGQKQYKNFMLYFVAELGLSSTHVRPSVPADHLEMIRVKTCRRLLKMDGKAYDFVLRHAKRAETAIRAILEGEQQEIVKSAPMQVPKSFTCTAKDLHISLENSRDYLNSAMSGVSVDVELSSFDRRHDQRNQRNRFGLPILRGGDLLSLADFESWVKHTMGSWYNEIQPSEHMCCLIGELLKSYCDLAIEAYSNSPDAMSMAMVCIIELWVILDKMCIAVCPLLGSYSPEIPNNFLEPLLLPQLCDMLRASKIETYIRYRQQGQTGGASSIFSDPGRLGFSVGFFDNSETHQRLREQVEEHARSSNKAKKKEWQRKSQLYEQLLTRASQISHQWDVDSRGRDCHSASCSRCLIENEANDLDIDVYEWPLPEDENILKSVIFELNCPHWFTWWRDNTWKLVQDLGRWESEGGPDVQQNLLSYKDTQRFCVNRGQRLTLGSTAKSWKRTHYSTRRFPVAFSDLTPPNGFRFRLLDSKENNWVADQKDHPSVKRWCTFDLPSGPYSCLQYSVDSSTHSENQIVADQQNCPSEISLHEFIAFGCLRAGTRVQWHNIVRELASSSLSMNEEAVGLLIRQAAWELTAPHPDSELREAHFSFTHDGLGNQMLECLERKLNSIEANWNEHYTLHTLVTLGLRALSLSRGFENIERAVSFLRRSRKTCLKWCEDLAATLAGQTDARSEAQQLLIVKIGGVCQLTYAVEPQHIPLILDNRADLFHLIRCSIMVFENTPRYCPEVPFDVRNSLIWTTKILHHLEENVLHFIRNDASGFNDAIKMSIPNLQITSSWNACLGNLSRWITNQSVAGPVGRPQDIHYNLLSGELLLANCPPGRLPEEYTSQLSFQRIFGNRTLTVLPSSLPGSIFMSTALHEGYSVHFSLDANNFVIKAQAEDQLLQLIPQEILVGDFPEELVFNHVHWLNLKTGTLEFRPLEHPWTSQSSNWSLSISAAPGGISTMSRPHSVGCSGYIHVTQTERDNDKTVEIHMVRLRLKFIIKKAGGLDCQEFNAMVDHDQDIGCLYGLRNKLVLLDTKKCCRSVLIPYGSVQLFKKKNHTSVTVNAPIGSHQNCFHYSYDRHLKVLQGSFDMLEILYLAYMHAVTSHIVPDSATERSGTAEAIRILRQECLRTSFPLSSETIALLKVIASLTPRRHYYPHYLESMQTVSWNSELRELAQHDDFRALAQEIVESASRFCPLHGVSDADRDKMMDCYRDRGNHHLLERARFRNSQFHYSEYGGNSTYQQPQPTLYKSRDRNHQSDRSHRVYKIASLVKNWRPCLSQDSDLLGSMGTWKSVRSAGLSVQNLSCSELLRLSIGDAWGSLYELCRRSVQGRDSYSLMSLFCTIAFFGEEEANIYPLLTVAFSGLFRYLPIPFNQGEVLDLSEGEEINSQKVIAAIEMNYNHFICPAICKISKAQKNASKQRQVEYDLQKEADIESCLRAINSQWPCEAPQLPEIERMKYSEALKACSVLCTKWYQNRQFLAFLRSVQNNLDTLVDQKLVTESRFPSSPRGKSFCPSRSFQPPSLLDILSSSNPPKLPAERSPFQYSRCRIPQCYDADLNTKLRSLILSFRESSYTCQRELGESLDESLEALQETDMPWPSKSLPVDQSVIVKYYDFQKIQRENLWAVIKVSLKATGNCCVEVCESVLSPHITSFSMLSLLSAHRWGQVPESWKFILLRLASSIASVRRAERLLNCYDRNDIDGFFKEAENVSQEGWNAHNRPDWLLFEIENNLTIREQQTQVALNIIRPETSANAVMQLNMGEGKTSVITPMAVLALADGSNLLRLFVLKPLLKQSVNLLAQRLGGMLGRRIYHLPFARDTLLDVTMLDQLRQIYLECQRTRGVLVVLPEQILSFRLVGLDLMAKNPTLAHQAISLERWLQTKSRNLIDESDEVLDPKFQLVYTVGSQQTVDGHSDRWEVTQALLALIDRQAEVLRLQDPNCLNIGRRGNRYPLFHFLQPETPDKIITQVLDIISEEGLPGLPIQHWTRRVRQSALDFIRFIDTTRGCRNVIQENFQGGVVLRKLLVLRGLFAHGILKFSLASKRWLVDYGLHPSRCLVAVPYRAKGIPSENAEFGHPDVAITLTCLSYYYQGLTTEQVRCCFALLGKESDPSAQYQSWIAKDMGSLPSTLRGISGVNLEDAQLFFDTLYPHLRYQKSIIDFYLSHVVFPREAKEFPRKLCASAWDIPSREDQPLTTGFSGTNDNRLLLPISIPQHDLPHLQFTNAMVLRCLLQKENRKCVLAQDEKGCQLSTTELIDLIRRQRPPVNVIIDVGAQILESSNRWVANHWLSRSTADDVEAAIFFDEDDEAAVIDREGHVERLLCSSFRQRMHRCLVFLDQQHARGVDLKLPSTYRAAVTIGPHLTKDRLVQACSRMRGLGVGQSVLFFIPPEVRQGMSMDNKLLDSLDVIRWTLKQTCDTLKSLRPLWASQGLQYYKRNKLWNMFTEDTTSAQDVVARIEEPEAQTLSQLYDPSEVPRTSNLEDYMDASDSTIRELLVESSSASLGIAGGPTLHEEQERQITHEVEREQQVYRPPRQEPLCHQVHKDIRYFVKYGQFPDNRTFAASLAFNGLRKTSVGRFNIPPSLGAHLYASNDFLKTVKRAKTTVDDQFLKSVHWILSNSHNDNLLILSQHEANELLPDIRVSRATRLHVYSPKTTKTMHCFDDLAFLTVGTGRLHQRWSREIVQGLLLFSGSLYFQDLSAYEYFRNFLGLVTGSCGNIPEGRVSNEGFVDEETRRLVGWPTLSPFRHNPLPFLRALLDLRSKGHGFSQTHVGMVLDVRGLTADHF